MTAHFSFSYEIAGRRFEWWTVIGTAIKAVRIDYDPAWFSREGSISDLKAMALAAGGAA